MRTLVFPISSRLNLLSSLPRLTIALALFCFLASTALAQSTQYLVTNDDIPAGLPNSVTFFTVQSNGTLALLQRVVTTGSGIAGGYFGTKRIITLNDAGTACVFSSEAGSGDITGIVISTFAISGTFFGSSTDTGTSNGIGMVANSQYLYASYTDSSNIGTFQIQPGCTLAFVGDITTGGLQGGIIDAMKLNGNILITTYADGSIESFNISGGVPVSNGDKQNSTAAVGSSFATYPSSIDITQDGHYAIFGDTSTSVVAEVSDISSGSLTKTVAHVAQGSISASNIMLSPDETLLYIIDTQGDRISAAFFDKSTGALTHGCTSGLIKGYVQNFSYLADLSLASTSGTGSFIYIAEFGAPSFISMVQVNSSGGRCSLQEMTGSPVMDPNSSGLLSIAVYPPRSF